MAPDARIVSLKVGAADGGVDVSQVIAAIDWVVQHQNDNGMNIRVINLSYGTNSTQDSSVDPLSYAVEQAWKEGIVVVAAAGNTGYQIGGSARPRRSGVRPVRHRGRRHRHDGDARAERRHGRALLGERALQRAVQATGLRRAGLAPAGPPRPGLVHRREQPRRAIDDRYFRGSGTREATAFASGAVALVLQKYPQMTPDQVKAFFRANAVTLTGFNALAQGAASSTWRRCCRHSAVEVHPEVPRTRAGTGTLEASRGRTT